MPDADGYKYAVWRDWDRQALMLRDLNTQDVRKLDFSKLREVRELNIHATARELWLAATPEAPDA